MNLIELTEEEYNSFLLCHDLVSIYQYPEWGKLKQVNGWDYFLVGLKKDNNIKAAALLLRKKIFANMYLFYSPRGYLIDSKDKILLKEFNNKIISFVKSKNGFMIKIDPNVIYSYRDKDGNIVEVVGDKDLQNYIDLGYNHLGFNKNFETLQPRFLCRYKIKNSYSETFETFSKNTKKNIIKAEFMGVKCEKCDINNLDVFNDLLFKTAQKNNFASRPLNYYKKMYELFDNVVFFYLTYIDVKLYQSNLNEKINLLKNENISFNNQLLKYKNGSKKLKLKIENNNNLICKFEQEMNAFDNNCDKIYIGCLMSVFTGNEGITFMSGIDPKYKKFNAKYAFYDYHLRECLKKKKEYVNFYGISGDFKEKSKYYHIYEIKKGYNPEVIELIGEFDFIISKSKYFLYKVILFLYKIYKKF